MGVEMVVACYETVSQWNQQVKKTRRDEVTIGLNYANNFDRIRVRMRKGGNKGTEFPKTFQRFGNMNKCMAFVATTIWKRFHVPPPRTQCRFYCSPPSHASSNKLFVGGLSWSVDHKSLKEAFSSFGDVTEVRIVYDKDSGRSRGFGFVIFSKEDDAKCAKDAMDGKALLGRPLRINFALERARGVPVVVPRLSDIGHVNRH